MPYFAVGCGVSDGLNEFYKSPALYVLLRSTGGFLA